MEEKGGMKEATNRDDFDGLIKGKVAPCCWIDDAMNILDETR